MKVIVSFVIVSLWAFVVWFPSSGAMLEGFREPAGRNIPGRGNSSDTHDKQQERFKQLLIEPSSWGAPLAPNGENPYADMFSNESPWFAVSERDVDVHISYAAWNNQTNQRDPNLEIGKKGFGDDRSC